MCLRIFQKEKNAFPRYKNKKLKKTKTWDFSKGVRPLFWSKTGNFSIFILWAKYARKMCFRMFQKEKKVLLNYKNNKLKKSKIWDFSKGVVTGFGQKLAIFPCLRIFQKETKAFPDYKNNKLKKAKIWDFSKENTVGVILRTPRQNAMRMSTKFDIR